jgi:hypothetical protein
VPIPRFRISLGTAAPHRRGASLVVNHAASFTGWRCDELNHKRSFVRYFESKFCGRFYDHTLDRYVGGKTRVGAYLERGNPLLPYGHEVTVRHVLGGDFEWTSRTGLRGISAVNSAWSVTAAPSQMESTRRMRPLADDAPKLFALRTTIQREITRLFARARKKGAIRPDFATEDLIFIMLSNSRVAQVTRSIAPDAWRRNVDFPQFVRRAGRRRAGGDRH